MQELRRSKSKKATNLDPKHSRKSIKSDNLHVPLTPSTFRKIIKTSASGSRPYATGKQRLRRIDQRKYREERGGDGGSLVRLSHLKPPVSELPENVAVHFSSFYKNQDLNSLPHSGDEKTPEPRKAGMFVRNFPKMEFTRQMVYKLEHSAGTQNYGKQVSAMLEDTVEAPGFDLKLPPLDNCAPSNKYNDYYPLWYRDPNKMPQISKEKFEKMKEKYQHGISGREFSEVIEKEEESIICSDSELELESETESEEYVISYNKDRESVKFSDRMKSHESEKSSRSTTPGTRNKYLENLPVNKKPEIEIPSCSSLTEHRECNSSNSWSSQTSCGSEGTGNYDEESLGWETETEEEDNKVEVKVAVNHFDNNPVLNQL